MLLRQLLTICYVENAPSPRCDEMSERLKTMKAITAKLVPKDMPKSNALPSIAVQCQRATDALTTHRLEYVSTRGGYTKTDSCASLFFISSCLLESLSGESIFYIVFLTRLLFRPLSTSTLVLIVSLALLGVLNRFVTFS
jgi:hypothetical protein